jgi:NAD(P)-dependent dehydrogenase (short-subunit alcohol dehydrogenase family)
VRQLDTGELPPLRGFVGNAGVQFTNDLTESPEGFEATFAVNVLANHVLLSRLRARITTPARVVITVSDTHFGDLKHNLGMVPGPAWQDPAVLARTSAFPKPDSAAAGRTAYSTSKLAAIYLIHEYARRLPDGIKIIGYNPGFVPGTGLAREAGPLARFAMQHVMPMLTLTPIATSRKAAGKYLADVVIGRTPAESGTYVDRTKVARSSEESYDPDRERRLWGTVEELTRAFIAEDDATPEPGGPAQGITATRT